MKLHMRARGIELTRKLETHIERRLRFALSRFGDKLRRVHVLVTDVNGPKGGEDIHCKVRAELSPRGEVVIREVNKDPFAAVARATDRVAQVVSRRVQRLHARRRGRVRGSATERRRAPSGTGRHAADA